MHRNSKVVYTPANEQAAGPAFNPIRTSLTGVDGWDLCSIDWCWVEKVVLNHLAEVLRV